MSDNLLTPESGIGAGILHRNSMDVASQGPWGLLGLTYGDAVDGPSDGEPTQPHHRPRGGTCAVCSASIINIADFANAAGARITVGLDCAETLIKNQSDKAGLARFQKSVSAHERAKRAAAKVRRLARNAAHNLGALAPELAKLDQLAAWGPGTFERSFGMSVARALRSGAARGLSPRQAQCLARLSEV